MRQLGSFLSANQWPAEHFPAELGPGFLELRGYLEGRVGADGSLRDLCRSRTLESVLALRLMERAGRDGACRLRVRVYLGSQLGAGAEPLDRALATLALGENDRPTEKLGESLLARIPSFVAGRRRMMLDAIGSLFGATPQEPDRGRTGLHPWARVQAVAASVILDAALGRAASVPPEDVRILLDTQRPGVLWENYVLAHVFVLHALVSLGGHEDVVAAGIDTLLGYQRADGGFPFVAHIDTWCASTGGVALDVAGADRATVRAVADHVASRQALHGGWSAGDGMNLCDVDDTSVALEFLQGFDAHRYRSVVDRGIRALKAVRQADGGFPTYVADGESEPCMTAAVINALNPRAGEHRELLHAARMSLAADQLPDGGFVPGWSVSRLHCLFRARLAAVDAAEPTVRRMAAAIDRSVVQTQNADGGWGRQPGDESDPISTSYAMIVLCCGADPRPAARAVSYLLGRQRSDGGVDSPPDQFGPRPFLFDVPLLADICSLMALGHLSSRLSSSATRTA